MSNFTGWCMDLCILILMHSPISVASEQWGTVGLYSTLNTGTLSAVGSFTKIPSSYTTFKSSSVLGFSGSRIVRKKSKTPQHTLKPQANNPVSPKTTRKRVKTNHILFLSGRSHLCTRVPEVSHFCPYKQASRAPLEVSVSYLEKVSKRTISYR